MTLKFKTAKELQDKIDEYFKKCDKRTVERFSNKIGLVLVNSPEPYTIAGLCLAVGLTRQSIINYGKKEQFYDIIKEAKLRIEYDIERRLNDKDEFTPGLIFNLKNNYNYKDKQEVDHTTKGQPILGGVSAKQPYAVPKNNSNRENN